VFFEIEGLVSFSDSVCPKHHLLIAQYDRKRLLEFCIRKPRT